MGDVLTAALQAAIAIAILFLLNWLTQKKEISRWSAFDFACFAAAGVATAFLAILGDYARGITAIVLFMLAPLLVQTLSSAGFRVKSSSGVPLLLVENGVIQKSNLKKSGMNEAELLMKCRSQGTRLQDIEFAVLDPDGRLYIQMPEGGQHATASGQTPYWGLSLNIIIEGKIIQEHLSIAERDINWILDELKRQNITDVHQVLLAYFDAANQFFVHPYK